MKILTISDTHSQHRRVPKEWLVPADMIIHAGDVSNVGKLNEIEDFCMWYDSLDYKYKIFCAGNHDWGFQREPDKVAEIIAAYPSITYVQDEMIIVDGVKIYCSPWQPEFMNWAFNLERGEEIKEKWDAINEECEILVTHGPVYGILDLAPGDRYVGCVDLLETITIRLKKLSTHICGHIHGAHGSEYKHGKTFINASVLNERYIIAYKPILLEFDKETRKSKLTEI